MKKLLKLALCLVLAASAAGCGNNNGAGTPTPDTSAAALTPGTYTATVTGHNAPIRLRSRSPIRRSNRSTSLNHRKRPESAPTQWNS